MASASEPPAVSVYPVAGAGAARAQPAHNPWQREERERQAEVKRAANRARRSVLETFIFSFTLILLGIGRGTLVLRHVVSGKN